MNRAHEPTAAETWVYGFNEVEKVESQVGSWDGVRALLGGKGANLADMTRIGVPVPPGFTLTTRSCNAFLAGGERLPPGLWDQVLAKLASIEAATGKKFGDARRPLLVSCRSGAKFSMPGMMDTVLNLGLNAQVAEGLITLTGDPHFVYDSFRRLIHMFGSVVLGIRDEPFEEALERARERHAVSADKDLPAETLAGLVTEFRGIVKRFARVEFPDEPLEQLRLAIEAVFKSWNGKRAIDYRNAAHIRHDLGTAVNIQTMVFGNMGDDSATGVAVTRSATTGAARIEGDFLVNAQGEDVVAGTRLTLSMDDLARQMPSLYGEFKDIAARLEAHYRDMQDVEFTIERGKLWILQTRNGKRTAQAAVRIAVELAEAGLITKDEALERVDPEQVEFFLHPQFEVAPKRRALSEGKLLATGLDVSPGAAVGVVAFDADLAERWAKTEGRPVVMVRPETKPDDVHGMLAAKGILTSKGGRTSHAALVARQFGKPAVVGVQALHIDLGKRVMHADGVEVHEGDWISIDGATGEVFIGQLQTMVPDLGDPSLAKLLSWADARRRLQVWTNADYADDARRGRTYGAQGIGLCRTEHMFFAPERLPIVQRMIMSSTTSERKEALAELLPMQRSDFAGLFAAMSGLPVIIRLIDPPLHEFLPSFEALTATLADEKVRLQHATSLAEIDAGLERIRANQRVLERVEALKESNPMLGLRGVRLGLMMPEVTEMQVRAIFEAACDAKEEGHEVHVEVMIPLTSHVNELKRQRELLEGEARAVMEARHSEVEFKFGTMIEIPRAALTADALAEYAEFLSFGTNDLTQTTYGISRDDAEASFLIEYLRTGLLEENPFASIDIDGVGQLMRVAVDKARKVRPTMSLGICGEHGGDPTSIAFCHALGLDYVSCSPPRVPIARLAAAHAAIRDKR